MDAELATLAGTAGTTIVAALVTDTWEKTRTALGALWRRVHPKRAEAVEAELVEARAELLAARAAGDNQVEQELVAEWQSRLRRLLAADPAVAGELRRILGDLAPTLPAGQVWTGEANVRATASGHGTNNIVVQGTQNITGR